MRRCGRSRASVSIWNVLPTPAAYPRKIVSRPRPESLTASVREDADVEAVDPANEAIQQAAGDTAPPRAPKVVADVELRDVALPGELEDGGDRIVAVEDRDLGVLRARQHDVARERRPILRGEVRLAHVDREELTVKTVGVAPAAGEHCRRIGAGRHADEDTLLRAPGHVDAIDAQVVVEL